MGSRSPPLCNYVIVALAAPLIYNALVCINQYLVTSISSSSERFYKTPEKDTTKRAKRHNFDADSKANLEVKRKARSDTPDFERLKIFDPEVAQKYYNDDEKLLNEFRTRDLTSLPNEDFIFHNKMPKCGGSTMNAILTQLSEWNDFNFVRLQANFSQFDLNEQFSRDLETIRNRNLDRRLFIFKHHYFFNAEKFYLERPTWINVIRDPLTWFESTFYFRKFGWERMEGERNKS